MQLRSRALIVALALCAVSAVAQEQKPAPPKLTADHVVARYIEAMGGEKNLTALQTLRVTGKMHIGEMVADMVIEQKRPNKSREEVVIGPFRIIETFNGAEGWKFDPTKGDSEPRPMTPAELAEAMDSGFDDELLQYASKGHKVELIGSEDVQGRPHHHLKLTRKNGKVRHQWIDASTFLVTKMVDDKDPSMEMFVTGYQTAAGVKYPTGIEMRQPQGVMRMEMDFQPNAAIDEARFGKPVLTQ